MTITAPHLWLDGRIVASRDAAVPLMGHAAQRGSLVFDVGSFHATRHGPALFRARDHVARFLRSASLVGLALPYDAETLLLAAIRVVAESGHDEGLVRWSAFFAAREPDLVPRDRSAHVAVASQALSDVVPSRPKPIKVAIFDDARKAAPEVLPPELKASGAYLGPMLARRRAQRAGADDVVLLDSDGDIAEAPIANAFAVLGGALVTPPLGRVLPGITRSSVITIAQEAGCEVREERLPRDVFASADEAFLTSTSLVIAPIETVNDAPLAASSGLVTKTLIDRMNRVLRGDESQHDEWLTRVQ